MSRHVKPIDAFEPFPPVADRFLYSDHRTTIPRYMGEVDPTHAIHW
jgi:hypothetical protein